MQKIYAHRGASGYAPENTLRAFALAADMGADGVELDVQISKDGRLVVFHDDELSRLTGFAGSVADAFTLSEKFEEKLTQCGGNLERAAVAVAQSWHGDQAMRQLDSLMIVADKGTMLILSGNGEVIDPDEGIAAIGSGGNYALAAARALMQNTDLSAHEIAEKALHIAASICVYTNDNVIVEEV